MAPDINTVVGHIEGQITDQADSLPLGPKFEPLPLALQVPLQQGFLQQNRGQLSARLGQGSPLALGQGRRPLPPGLAAMAAAQGHKQAVILQPWGLAAAPAAEFRLPFWALGRPGLGQGDTKGFGPPRGLHWFEPIAAGTRG